MIHRIRVYGLTCLLVIVAATAGATTIVMPTDDQLVAKSPVIVRGVVVSSTPFARGNAVWTETRLDVVEAVKGDVPSTVTILEAGGVLGERMTMIFGAPKYVPGEEVLAFLAPTPRGGFQTVDLFVGKFTAAEIEDGRAVWIRSESEPHVDLLTPELEPVEPTRVVRDAARFQRYVAERAAGRPAERDYVIASPGRQGLRSEANFTLIAEPTVYRWFAFDDGQRVSWRSHGTQPGYPGGGVNEVNTGIASWANYSEAKILYAYDGTFSTTPGGLERPNGINEVLLNDPLNEIAGSFSPSTGGVVGRGGFNGVSSSRNWTSPFAADASHPQTSYRAWNIVEGNLVIQDGVSPANGMSSNRLAEIIAHEFGHTLGFGHSADTTALMYANVTGLGPSLRDDDRLAARWLYPAGSSQPPPPPPAPMLPAAPSGLTATLSGSSVLLQWIDNATDESGFNVYWAAATGSFTRLGTVGPNQRSTSLTGFGDGTWRFYITAFNSAGESQASNTAILTIGTSPTAPLVASFTYSPASPVVDDPVSFTDTSSGGVTSRLWSFGDGSTSTQPTPVKRYEAPGTYNVTLTVYRGSESRVASQSIAIAGRAPVLPPVEAYHSLVPVTAQSEGVGGSVWRTELTLFNGGNEGADVRLVFVPGAGGAVQSRTLFLAPRQSHTYANALRDVFAMTSGSGAIAVEATGATAKPLLKVTSRTFNDTPGGTYGLAVPDVVASDLQQTLYVTGLVATTDYRTNLGLVNRSGNSVNAVMVLYGSGGNTLATANVTVPANSFQQEALAGYFPAAANRTFTAASVRVSVSAPHALSVYASVIDNRTHDPLYLSAVPLPSRNEAVVPVVGRAAGANSTFWRSDVTLFNPGGGFLPVTLRYGGRTKALLLAPNETVVVPDVVAAMGFDSGIGVLVLTWTSSTGPIVTSRNYTEGGGGTFGQSVDPVATFGSDVYVTGLRSDAAFRANLGFVNGGSQGITVTATLFGAGGNELGSTSFVLSPDQLVQSSVAALFPGVNTTALGTFTLRARANGNGLFAYGSVVDNASGDPVFFGGK